CHGSAGRFWPERRSKGQRIAGKSPIMWASTIRGETPMRLTEKGRRELRELTWRLVDDEIDEPQFRRLESSLLQSEEARQVYVECIWLHSELLFYFRKNDQAKPTRLANDPLLIQILESQSPPPLPKPRKSRTLR